MSRSVLVALLALYVLAPALANKDTRESVDDSEIPPQEFPDNKALKFDATKLPTPKTPLEVPDLNKDNDTESVKHPKVSDPGTTHAEEGSRGSIHACALPNLHEANSSASNWLADTGNVTKVCHLPLKWLHGASSGTLRVCSIPHDAWNTSYTVTDGTIPKEVFAELNTSSVKCVTPSEALSNGSSVAATNGSLPSAWLRSNDTIYIYIIPQEWLLKTQLPPEKASEVEDLTKDTLDVVSSTPNPIESSSVPSPTAGSSVTPSSADVISTTLASTVVISSNNTETKNVTDKTQTSIDNSTVASSPPNTSMTTVVTPTSKNTETSVSPSTTPASAVPVVSVNTTEKNKEVTSENPKEATATKPAEKQKEDPTKTTEKPKEEATKTTEKPAVTVTTVASKKTEETTTKKANETTEKSKDIATSEEHSDKDNEIVHRDPSPQPPEALSQQHSEHNHATTGKTAFLQPTESAAILAGVFVAIALLGYAGLLLWRRVLEKRYGNREMLVNEDDDFDTSDMRHFEL